MSQHAARFVCDATGAASARAAETVQELWSGYGRIVRYELSPAQPPPAARSVILKHTDPPPSPTHARNWAGAASHARKLRSYEVEAAFYRAYAPRLAGVARVPALLRAAAVGASGERLLALEDLDAAGYAARVCRGAVADAHVRACLRWLARLHATFLARAGAPRPGLWETGCYWHLGTRPEELAAMGDCALKRAAPAIDRRLAAVRWVTIVHGDAKLANFCFPCPGSVGEGEGDVAAVDFQYCGGGVGVRDVAYLLGSCLDEEGLERDVERLLVAYFAALRAAAKHVCEDDQNAVEAEWRALWPWAVADFERFLAGWAPRHWKMNRYTARLADKVAQSCAP